MNSQEKEQVKSLWKRCFHDSEAFVDFYFAERYNDAVSRTLYHEGKVVAALQAIPYPMTFYGDTIATAYISGACTDPDYRSRGYMAQLLDKTHRQMFDEGILLSTLIPAEESLKNYYGRFGYADCFGYGERLIRKATYEQVVDNSVFSLVSVSLNQAVSPGVYHYFKQAMAARSYCIQHSKEDFQIILGDLKISGGELLVVDKVGQIAGLAFLYHAENGLLVKELLFDETLSTDQVLQSILSYYQAESLYYLFPAQLNQKMLGMGRAIHVQKLLDRVAAFHPELNLSIHITGDEAIPQNNGCYVLQDGVCRKMTTLVNSPLSCNISRFTQLLFEAVHPYMSLMLD